MSKVYCKTLKELCRAIQNERHGMLTSSVLVVLLHDNARLHTAACMRALLEHFSWELFGGTLLIALMSLLLVITICLPT
jgi:hypothetical protein